ncbi:MAG: hypothetical protein GY853_05145 [PVC group bacterium]|nr:hypothetical protein [PVC group bacterium]
MKEIFSKPQATIRDLLLILFHRKKYFLLPALIVFFTASIGSFFLPKYYSSSVLLLVQDEKVINPLAREQQISYSATQENLAEQLRTFSEKILNFPQLVMVIQKLGIDRNLSNPLDREKFIRAIRKRTDIRLRSPEVIEVRYEDKDPQMARKLVNTLVNCFIDYNRQKKEDLALTGVKFAEGQAEVYRKYLEKSEESLYEFQTKFSFQNPGKDTDINVSLLINHQTSLTNTKLNLQEIENQLQKLDDQLTGKIPVMLNEDLMRANPIIESINQQIKTKQLQIDDLMVREPASEQLLDLEVSLDALRRRLVEETEKMIDSQTRQTAPLFYKQLEQRRVEYQERIKELNKRVMELNGLVEKYESRIATLPEQDRVYAELQRDTRVNNNIYEMLRFKVEENRLDAIELQQKGTRYEVLESGRTPLKPSKPQKLLISIIALFLGIITGFGCVFLIEGTDHSFRTGEDVRKFIDVPFVGSTNIILTQEEFSVKRRKRFSSIAIFTLVFVIFIVIAVVTSYVQEQKLTERVLKEQIENEL